MAKYIIKRLIQAFFVILLIAVITFFLMNLVPGGPFLTEKALSPEVLAAKEAKYGLDKPLLVQLKNYICDLFKLDLGVSFKMQINRPVLTIILEMFPVSCKLGAVALLWAILWGIPIGCLAAYYRGTWVDNVLRIFTTIGVSIPGFVVATVLLVIFGVKLRVLPTIGLYGPLNYIMPVIALSLSPMCYVGRLTRASMLDVINQEYIRTAKAKGLKTRIIIFKHALRNSLIPVLTYLGPLTANILTGGFVVETVFSIPGLGRYFVQSIGNRDYPIILGTTIFLAAFVVFMTLIVDILYRVVDPRMDLSKETN
jgi:oligopeptide transport system permease protein